jgi:hypothetical protein
MRQDVVTPVPAVQYTSRVGIRRRVLVLLAGFGATGAGATTGCGPSYQAVYECDVNFEHCYALDEGSGSRDTAHAKACWREWLHSYTYGQSADRIEYAGARFSELSLDPTLPNEDTAIRPKRNRGMVAPLPTSAFAPPPNLGADHGDGPATPPSPSTPPPTYAAASGPPRPVVVAPQAPGEQCTSACAERWNGCRKGCADGVCDGCDRAYKSCVPGCFSDVRQPPRSLR